MAIMNDILKGIGSMFILLAYLCTAATAFIFLRDLTYRVTGVSLTAIKALGFLSLIVYIIAAIPITIMLFSGKKKAEEPQQNDMMSYVSDIYVNVNKNTEVLNAIVEYLQSKEQPVEPEQK